MYHEFVRLTGKSVVFASWIIYTPPDKITCNMINCEEVVSHLKWQRHHSVGSKVLQYGIVIIITVIMYEDCCKQWYIHIYVRLTQTITTSKMLEAHSYTQIKYNAVHGWTRAFGREVRRCKNVPRTAFFLCRFFTTWEVLRFFFFFFSLRKTV